MGSTVSRPIVDGIGIVFPAYKTVLCIQDGSSVEEKDQWLRYWAVFGAFRIVEYFADRLVLWSPLYYPAKIGLLALMLNPSTEVKDKIFKRIVLPFVQRHRARIDATLGKASRQLKEAWALVWNYAMKLVQTVLAHLWFSNQTRRRRNVEAGDGVEVPVPQNRKTSAIVHTPANDGDEAPNTSGSGAGAGAGVGAGTITPAS